MKKTKISPFAFRQTPRPGEDIIDEPTAILDGKQFSIQPQTIRPAVCVVLVGKFGRELLEHIGDDDALKSDIVLVDCESAGASGADRVIDLPASLQLYTDSDAASTAVFERRGLVANAVSGYQSVMIIASLSDALSCGTATMLTAISRESSRQVIGFAVMPFSFESRVVKRCARNALGDWQREAHSIISIQRDRLGDQISDSDPLDIAIETGVNWLVDGIRAMVAVASQPLSLTPGAAGFMDFIGNSSICQIGWGSASGADCLFDAVKNALEQSLLTRADLLDAGPVLVQVASATTPTLRTLDEVSEFMQSIAGRDADIRFAFGRDAGLSERVICAVYVRASERIRSRRALTRQHSGRLSGGGKVRNVGGLFGLHNRNIPSENNYDIPTFIRRRAG